MNKEASLFLTQKQNRTSKLDPIVRQIFQRESAAYEKADVILTITDDDKEKMLITLDQEFDLLMHLVYNEKVRIFIDNIHHSLLRLNILLLLL